MRGSGSGIIWQGPRQSGAIVGADGADHATLCRGRSNATGPEGVDPIQFERTERNDERTWACLRDFTAHEGVLYMGKAQEKARVVRRSVSRPGVGPVSVAGAPRHPPRRLCPASGLRPHQVFESAVQGQSVSGPDPPG